MVFNSSSHGERRQLTVMFADIVGSTEISAQLDPEDWHDIVTQYHHTATSAVKRMDGHVEQYLGDGILILFGFPKAHENDAERAIRSGLLLLDDMKELNKTLEKKYKRKISVRIGIHTGEVMVRSEGGETSNIFGEAPNVAARVQSEAEPNTVCISSATQRLVAGFFFVEDLGQRTLKGVPEPIRLYKVQQTTGVRGRLHATSKNMLSEFVGREEERKLLRERWKLAQNGKGQLIMITGEAGIGKSRLLQQFKEELGGTPHTWVEGESSPYEQDTPFAPTLDVVQNALQWKSDTTPEEKIDGLERVFKLAGLDPAKSVPLIASLFGLTPDRYPPLLLSPEQQRVQLLQTLVDWVTGTARLQPLVLVVEDLHYADPSTLEEFTLMGEQIENVPLLLLFTARPRFQPPWPTRDFHTLITLNRLDQQDIRGIIAGLLGKLIPADTLEALVTRTDGVPLFAEEISHTMAETNLRPHNTSQIPSTLHDLLMARLDYLGPTKDIAQMGSIFGREFPYSLLSTISGMTDEKLQEALARLIESGLVYAEKSSTDTTYIFKHALVQEAAYTSLLKSRRRELHRAAAKALNESFLELTKLRPELVAHHLTEAGEAEQAVEAWQIAGERAASRGAYMEAGKHFSRALEVLYILPDSPDRAQLELPIQISIGHVVSAIKGFGSQEEIQAYARAKQIAEQLGDSPQFFFILLGLWSTSNTRSEINAAQEVADEMLRIAERDKTSMPLVWACLTQAIQSYGRGDFSSVGQYYEKLIEQYNPDEYSWAPFDPAVSILTHTSLALWHLGLVEQARQKSKEQLERGLQISAPNEAMGRLGACTLNFYLREGDAMHENAKRILEIAEEQKLPSFMAWGTMYCGAALILQGKPEEGLPLMSKGVGEYLASGTHSSLGQYLCFMAEGYAQMGDMEQAIATMENAFGAAPEERMHFPELYRVHADLLLKKPDCDLDEVENEYREAIRVSQQFGSITQELRAVTRLGRLLQSRGRSGEALGLLTPLFEKFSEGFDTHDLCEAKSLLIELSVNQST